MFAAVFAIFGAGILIFSLYQVYMGLEIEQVKSALREAGERSKEKQPSSNIPAVQDQAPPAKDKARP